MKRNSTKTLQNYIDQLKAIEVADPNDTEYGSILILTLLEEIGEMARAYLAKHGRKPTNIKAQQDETYRQELGDLLVSIMKFAIYKNIDLDERIEYTIRKIKRRKLKPKS